MKNDYDIQSTQHGLSITIITDLDNNDQLIVPPKYKSLINSRLLTNKENLKKFVEELNSRELNNNTT